jgi:hypothetical protein
LQSRDAVHRFEDLTASGAFGPAGGLLVERGVVVGRSAELAERRDLDGRRLRARRCRQHRLCAWLGVDVLLGGGISFLLQLLLLGVDPGRDHGQELCWSADREDEVAVLVVAGARPQPPRGVLRVALRGGVGVGAGDAADELVELAGGAVPGQLDQSMPSSGCATRVTARTLLYDTRPSLNAAAS